MSLREVGAYKSDLQNLTGNGKFRLNIDFMPCYFGFVTIPWLHIPCECRKLHHLIKIKQEGLSVKINIFLMPAEVNWCWF